MAAQARWFVFSGQLLDTLETDNPTAIRASAHGGHTGLRNQVGIYLYDDFAFYRGLLGDLLAWSAAGCQVTGQPEIPGVGPYRTLELSNAGSSMLRWALAIRPGGKWLESKVQRLPQSGFRLQAWQAAGPWRAACPWGIASRAGTALPPLSFLFVPLFRAPRCPRKQAKAR